MTFFEELMAQGPEALADTIAKFIVTNVRGTIESNYGTTGNDVMWERYLKEHRQATLEFLNRETLELESEGQ